MKSLSLQKGLHSPPLPKAHNGLVKRNNQNFETESRCPISEDPAELWGYAVLLSS